MITLDTLRSGDRKALARAITLLESTRTDHRQQAEQLVQDALPFSGSSLRVGITGIPGVGKSTLIEQLGSQVIELGHRIAVLAVDPSSRISGGSIMGDKTRMETLSTSEHAFIRPTPAGNSIGGIARRTRESIILCEAAGYDVIIVETVGVGQSETMVSEMTDIFLLMLLPGSGDELQGIKRGIMELADIVLISKSDSDFATQAALAAADVQQALRFLASRIPDWDVPVLQVSARDRKNIDLLWSELERLRNFMTNAGQLEERRQLQLRHWLWHETRELLLERLEEGQVAQSLTSMEQEVVEGRITPGVAARTLVEKLFER